MNFIDRAAYWLVENLTGKQLVLLLVWLAFCCGFLVRSLIAIMF